MVNGNGNSPRILDKIRASLYYVGLMYLLELNKPTDRCRAGSNVL